MCIVEILQNVGGGFMNLLFKLLLTINATSWFLIIYAVKEKISIFSIPCVIFHIVLILTVVFLSWISLLISKCFDKEILDSCAELSLADNEFLSVYLGYFFVSLSVPDGYTMSVVYLLVFIFTFLSQTQYFNPIYLLFGYHYYHIQTPKGTKVFAIVRGRVIRNKDNLQLINLRRINNTTFIERR